MEGVPIKVVTDYALEGVNMKVNEAHIEHIETLCRHKGSGEVSIKTESLLAIVRELQAARLVIDEAINPQTLFLKGAISEKRFVALSSWHKKCMDDTDTRLLIERD